MQEKINNIIHSDCLDYLTIIDNNTIDLILIDPPYGVNFKNNFYNDSADFVKEESKKWLKELYRVLKDNCHCYIFTGTKSLSLWLNNVENSDFQFNNILNVPACCNGRYLKNNFYFRTEHILYLSKGKAKNFNKVDFIKTSDAWLNDKRNLKKQEFTYSYPNFWDFIFVNQKANTKKLLHPNEKNVELLKILIQLSTNENDIVLDCFAGSGSVGLSALKTKRRFLSCEKDLNYAMQAQKRIDDYVNSGLFISL